MCTYQPVVNGGACPWNLDCENCDKFVMSGADLLYWRRKQEQWRAIAERAPDDATADYLHQVFEPTARAIDGLEKALAGLGLLEQALALDLRRPQDYFHRIWSTAFRARPRRSRDEAARPCRPESQHDRPGRGDATAAATQARRASIAAMIQRVDRACSRCAGNGRPSLAAVARRAGVSRSFLYQNANARALVTAAAAGHAKDAHARAGAAGLRRYRALAERALNAESSSASAQRDHSSARPDRRVLGRIRDLEHDLPRTASRGPSPRTTPCGPARQLTQDNRRLEDASPAPATPTGSSTSGSRTWKPSSAAPRPAEAT